ncbi:Phospholipase A(1) protein [Dioscorea alata]|uniref:Phospholipase A(1) protein n=1 Tax=Dioscorea alata TaxID=55571 RepID=A0ACB7W0K0_DIOAL|nr:Phospholipase A(1) protein [Dioscorea alata]
MAASSLCTSKLNSSAKERSSSIRRISTKVTNVLVSQPMTKTVAPVAVTSLRETKKPEIKPVLASVWKEIQGADDWEDLMEPLNPLLRDEIVRYGEFVSACYKAFDLEPSSKRYLNCKYGRKNMFAEVGMEKAGYDVVKYIYATPDISIPMQSTACCGRWIGYVAVSNDEETKRLGRRDVLVSFRGTVTQSEWIANFMSSLTPARLDPTDARVEVKVESGFLNLYTSDDSTCKFSQGSCRQQLLSEISRMINKYKGEEMSITLAGHSLGSSLATLLGYDLAELGLNRDGNNEIQITVYSFGGPRVGNSEFKKRCEELGVKVLRVVNVNDPVTKMPGVFLNENSRVLGGKFELPWSCSCYAHVGVELALDFFKMKNPTCVHDLDAYIGLLKCPNMEQMNEDGETFNLFHKLMEIFSSQEFVINHAWPWHQAATYVGSLVQSLGI